jgi:hypothetical protein
MRADKDQFWEKLEGIAVQLYQKGPEDTSIWSRAGGDLSLLTFSTSPRGTWHNALRALRLHGGGTAISRQRLLEVMLSDFQSNEELKMLAKFAGIPS